MKNLQLISIFLVAIYLNPIWALFHQSSSRQNGQSALFSHFGQPSAQQLANLTSASHFTQPFYYEYERDPRQWLGGYGGAGGYTGASPFGGYGNGLLSNGFGSIEAVVVCLLVIVGVGVLGFPMLLLLFSLFSSGLGTPSAGFNFIPPSSTTTVNGRRKRSTNELNSSLMKRLLEINSVNDLLALKELTGLSELVMANVRPEIREKAIEHFKKFANSADKIEYIKSVIN